ncbi:MAG: hypothetical protein HY804_10945 [Nitrospinae bacterium]|nr:hypothetical protein [Nitrospinota bacterium]
MTPRALIIAALAALAVPAWAQEQPASPWLVSLSANYGAWRASGVDSDGSQALGFVQASYATDAYGASVTGVGARTSYLIPAGTERFEITTISDTDIATYYLHTFGAVTLRGGVDARIPTGKHAYTDTELSSIFLDDLSGDLMLVNSYGGGFDVTPHFLAIYNFDGFVAGAGFKYEFTGEYDPTTDTADDNFNPGDRLTALVNAVYTVGESRYAMLTLSYSRSEKDTQGGVAVYRAGDTYSAEGRLIWRWANGLTSVASASYRTQTKDELLGEESLLVSEISNSNNNLYELFVNNVYQYAGGVSFSGLIGYKQALANGYAEGDALYDAGRAKLYLEPGVIYNLSDTSYASFKLRYTYLRDLADAFSASDATYSLINADISLVTRF